MGLRGRLALFFLVITVVPLIGAVVVLQLQIDAQGRERTAADLAGAGSSAVAVTEAARLRAGDLATELARRGAGDVLAGSDPAAARAWLDRQELDERADVVALVGAGGSPLATRVTAQPPPTVPAGIDAVTAAVRGGGTAPGVLLAVREVRGDSPDRLLGHVAAGRWLDAGLLSPVTPLAGGGAAFLAGGEVVTASGAPPEAIPVPDLPPAGVEAVTIGGQAVLAGTTPLQPEGAGSLVLWVPDAGRALPLAALALLAATLLAAVGLVWLLAGGIAAPVRRAAAFAREVAEGDVSGQLRPAGGRELADLAEALNAMSAELMVDRLTRLWNRRYVELATDRELERATRSGSPVSLLIVDVDAFKSVNDDLRLGGHDAGDEVLVEVGRRLQAETRAPDVAARFGGDEFVVLLPDADYEGALATAERIRTAVAGTPVSLAGVPGSEAPGVRVTCSIGVASWPRHGRDRKALMRAADDALLRLAKRSGGNGVSGADDL